MTGPYRTNAKPVGEEGRAMTERQIGRTTRMMREAADVASRGGDVVVVCHQHSFIPYLVDLCGGRRKCSPGLYGVGSGEIRFVPARGIDRIRGRSYDGIFVDHYVWECGQFDRREIESTAASCRRPGPAPTPARPPEFAASERVEACEPWRFAEENRR